jgi:hypothetical protein
MAVVACGHNILLQLLVQRSKMWPWVCPLSETVHELAARIGRRRKARPMEPSFGAFRDVAMHTSAKKGSHFKLTTGASIGDRKFNWICSYVRRVKEIGLWIFCTRPGSVEILNVYLVVFTKTNSHILDILCLCIFLYKIC